MLVSQRVVDLVVAAGLCGVHFFPVELQHPRKGRNLTNPFNYYIMAPEGEALRCREVRFCVKVQNGVEHYERTEARGGVNQRTRTVMIFEQADRGGRDLMPWSQDSVYAPGGHGLYCSRRFAEIAWRSKFTGCNISPADSILWNRCVSILDRPWPPELWYAENEPEL